MSDFVKKEDAIRICKMCASAKYRVPYIEQAFDDAPSIDIVRCRECKYAHMTYGGECKYCDKWSLEDSLYLDGDFFCSYGKVSEKPTSSERSSE